MAVDLILCDIIVNEMALDASRVVVYDQNFDAPDDDNIFVVIATKRSRIVGNTNRFDPGTNAEIKSVVLFDYLDVEITSKNRDALDRKEEILMAIDSDYSIRQQEDNNIEIFRTKEIIDISFIDGTSALHRFRIPVIIANMKQKSTGIDPIDKFREPEIELES